MTAKILKDKTIYKNSKIIKNSNGDIMKVDHDDVIYAVVAGLVSLVMAYVFKLYDFLDEMKTKAENGEENRYNLKILFPLWTLEALIKGFVGALLFFSILHFLPNINLVFNYLLSAVVAQNALMILEVIRQKTKEKLERL